MEMPKTIITLDVDAKLLAEEISKHVLNASIFLNRQEERERQRAIAIDMAYRHLNDATIEE